MTLEIQFKIKNNPNYQKYLRENSFFFFLLNRSPNLFKNFYDDVKHDYRLKFTDRIGETLKTIEMIQNVLSTLK